MNDAIEKLLSSIDYAINGCWEWTGGLTPAGYGQFTLARPVRHIHSHRLAYELFVGPIPKGYIVHHRCHNPKCCNPDHLESLSPRQHSILHNAKSVCKNGHPFTEENTYVAPTRPHEKQCRQCHKEWRSARKEYLRDYMREYRKTHPRK